MHVQKISSVEMLGVLFAFWWKPCPLISSRYLKNWKNWETKLENLLSDLSTNCEEFLERSIQATPEK